MGQLKRFLRSHRLILTMALMVACGGVLSSLLWYQQNHPAPSQAAMEWDRYLMEADNVLVGNSDFSVLNANTHATAFVDRLTGDVFFQRSDDGGQTWDRTMIEAGTGEVNETRVGLIDIDFVDTNNLFVAFASEDRATIRLAVSTDGGTNWSVSEYDGTGFELFGGLVLDAFDANNVALAYNKNIGPDNILLSVSSDGGATFSTPLQISAVLDDEIAGVQMVSANDIFVFYGTNYTGTILDARVAVSTDGGASIDFSTLVGDIIRTFKFFLGDVY